jgi:hypothetical protein
MLSMSSNWLARQWQEVSGNVKFAVLLLFGTGIMSVATALIHGLATWQQVVLVALFALMFGWALIATFLACRPKQGGFIVTHENVESYVRQWLDNFHVTAKKLPKNDQLNFAYQVDYEDRTHVGILHTKERNQYLAIEGRLAVSKEHKDAFDKFSEPKKRRFLLGLRAEMSRAGIRAEMPHPFETVRIIRLFPITTLTESEFIEQIDGVHRTELLVIDTINLGLAPAD